MLKQLYSIFQRWMRGVKSAFLRPIIIFLSDEDLQEYLVKKPAVMVGQWRSYKGIRLARYEGEQGAFDLAIMACDGEKVKVPWSLRYLFWRCITLSFNQKITVERLQKAIQCLSSFLSDYFYPRKIIVAPLSKNNEADDMATVYWYLPIGSDGYCQFKALRFLNLSQRRCRSSVYHQSKPEIAAQRQLGKVMDLFDSFCPALSMIWSKSRLSFFCAPHHVRIDTGRDVRRKKWWQRAFVRALLAGVCLALFAYYFFVNYTSQVHQGHRWHAAQVELFQWEKAGEKKASLLILANMATQLIDMKASYGWSGIMFHVGANWFKRHLSRQTEYWLIPALSQWTRQSQASPMMTFALYRLLKTQQWINAAPLSTKLFRFWQKQLRGMVSYRALLNLLSMTEGVVHLPTHWLATTEESIQHRWQAMGVQKKFLLRLSAGKQRDKEVAGHAQYCLINEALPWLFSSEGRQWLHKKRSLEQSAEVPFLLMDGGKPVSRDFLWQAYRHLAIAQKKSGLRNPIPGFFQRSDIHYWLLHCSHYLVNGVNHDRQRQEIKYDLKLLAEISNLSADKLLSQLMQEQSELRQWLKAKTLPQAPVTQWQRWFLKNICDYLRRFVRDALQQRWQDDVLEYFDDQLSACYPFNTQSSCDLPWTLWQKFIANDRHIAGFRELLRRLPPELCAKKAGLSPCVSASIVKALRQLDLWPSRGASQSLVIHWSPLLMSSNLRSFSLKLGTQRLDYHHGAKVQYEWHWPVADAQSLQLRVRWQRFSSHEAAQNYRGTWSLTQFLQRWHGACDSVSHHYRLHYKKLWIVFEVPQCLLIDRWSLNYFQTLKKTMQLTRSTL